MRQAAERGQSLDRQVPRDFADLRQVADPPRPLATARQRRAVEQHGTGIGLDQPGEALQQRRLARAVRAANGGDPAALEHRLEPGQPARHPQRFYLDH
jgi:hypothetical protein